MKDNNKSLQPPSLFDDMDLFGIPSKKGSEEKPQKEAEVSNRSSAAPSGAKQSSGASNGASVKSKPESAPQTIPAMKSGLAGHGPLKELFDFNFRQYSAYVICSRAIPAIEDGLKPVQRRILHSLYEKDDGNYTKVANVVGHAMQYHPHGDASIADAIVVLANKLWGEGKGYLIDGQGNFGNLYTGMPAAASRYIECRLTALARNEVFNPKTTDYVPNYDGRRKEPVFLPSKLPLLLMMGADGIAVGLATSVLPHNFIELLEAEINIIQKKPVELFPDFQTGGVVDVSEYQDGLGKVKVRAVIEPRDKNKLVITALPWGKTTDSLIDNIEDAIKKKKVQVRKIHDLTAENVEIELELSAGASQEKVTTELFAFTDCERSISSRPIALVQGRPRLMTVTEILKYNTERLLELVKREQEIRLAELDALFHARTLDRIFIEERIYKRIEKEKTLEGVQKAVRDGFKPFLNLLRHDITDEDIERLLKIQIRRISQFDIDKNRTEIKNILAEEKEVKDNLVHLRAFTVKYIKGLIKTYAKLYPRISTVSRGAFRQADVRKLTATELTVRHDTEGHFVGSALKTGEELFKCSSLDKLLFVWKDGRYKLLQAPERFFVDKDLLSVFIYNPKPEDPEKPGDPSNDRNKQFTAVYVEPLYGLTYMKRFVFGGCIQNKEYRLAPEKSKLIYFEEGCPESFYVSYKPKKGQRINQQTFNPAEVAVRGATSRGIQMTSKSIAKLAVKKPSWWNDAEEPSQGVLM